MANTAKPEIAQLLRRINEGATSSQIPLGETLRLCLRLGSLLGNRELSNWAKAEAEGYESRSGLPEYRIFDTDVLGTFSGPHGSGIKNAPIPTILIDEEHRDMLFKVYIMQSVGRNDYRHQWRNGRLKCLPRWPHRVYQEQHNGR
jgi:hypothetical protein